MKSKRRRLIFNAALMLLGTVVLCALNRSQATTYPTQQTRTTKTPDKKQREPIQRGQEIDADDVIRIDTTMVNSPVLVIGRNGKFVPNLSRDDFMVFENGVEQEIAHFSPVEKPFTVALLIDTSRSTSVSLQDIQEAAIAFVDKMRPNDRALVISFAEQIKVLAEPTSNKETLRLAIRSSRPQGSSRIYDAISFALADRLENISGRTALIVFSDGVDNDSQTTLNSALQLIEKSQVLVFPVQFNTFDSMVSKRTFKGGPPPRGSGFSQEDYARADAFLHKAADLSGTGVYPAQEISDLEYAIANISEELHNEYSVGYYPRSPLKPTEERRVEVRTKLPQLVVRARTSYSLDPSGTVQRAPTMRSSMPQLSTNSPGAIPSRRSSTEVTTAIAARWVCKSVDVSTEFAVVKEGFVSHCPRSTRPNDETNAWYIVRPAPSQTMCKGFLMWRGRELPGAPIPTGYVVSSEVNSPDCSKSNDPQNPANAWKIHRPQGRVTVCKGFPLPRGYVTLGEESVAGCPSKPGGKNAWIIRPK